MNTQTALAGSSGIQCQIKKNVSLTISRPPSHVTALLSERQEGRYYYIPRGYRALLIGEEKLFELAKNGYNDSATSWSAYLPPEGPNQVTSAHVPTKIRKYVASEAPPSGPELEGMQRGYSNFYAIKMVELAKCKIYGDEASRIIMSIWQQISSEERALFH
ncbi:hypothetical protein K493DRAFT_342224 [Basidiobolus meristosporus CBS 931.73]|uniref:Uncharacterized protein n=1 Tax=Basidiobolus meristosporus CBS 931.73 TaxID=1314790 RepID=A0A1Y1X9Y5_9FUNG|nr:hypothetical protein K493DRAFT_342224 [Basidiobolus meristosporus CBS 931.73]|eukprot:ORX82236.1 hypothetical protein K493DRAFT_342224 [Basidiobolus meristosporus CBS 931.73]